MRVVDLPSTFYQLSKRSLQQLTPEAQERLRWVNCCQTLRDRGMWASAAAEVSNLSRWTLYRWAKALREEGPVGLLTKSRRPRRVRRPTWSPELAQAVLELRERHPRWGKDKLVLLLRRRGWSVSTSMTGRILRSLKARGVLKEPPRHGISTRRRTRPRPYGVRKPREYQAIEPGDIVQVDTLDVRPLPGLVLKHFTARDVVSRWDVIQVHTRATSNLAAQFLHTMRRRFPFPVKADQVDGGSEFMAAFESACRDLNIRLFVLPLRSPKLNGHMERAQRTHTEEFYELYDGELDIKSLNRALLRWERIYDTFRPHHSLDGRTPAQYLIQCHPTMALDHSVQYLYPRLFIGSQPQSFHRLT